MDVERTEGGSFRELFISPNTRTYARDDVLKKLVTLGGFLFFFFFEERVP